jgi:hypothetical protein
MGKYWSYGPSLELLRRSRGAIRGKALAKSRVEVLIAPPQLGDPDTQLVSISQQLVFLGACAGRGRGMRQLLRASEP